MRTWIQFCVENRNTIIVTFEVFWILVFLLRAATSSSGAEITGFVYANF